MAGLIKVATEERLRACPTRLLHVKMISPVICWRLKSTYKAIADRVGVLLMDEFIAKANIEHFKEQLKTETDEGKRRVLERLLADEEQKLAAALRRRRERNEG